MLLEGRRPGSAGSRSSRASVSVAENSEFLGRGASPKDRLHASADVTAPRRRQWIRETYGDELPFCPQCGFWFSTYDRLCEHMEQEHGRCDLKRKPESFLPVPKAKCKADAAKTAVAKKVAREKPKSQAKAQDTSSKHEQSPERKAKPAERATQAKSGSASLQGQKDKLLQADSNKLLGLLNKGNQEKDRSGQHPASAVSDKISSHFDVDAVYSDVLREMYLPVESRSIPPAWSSSEGGDWKILSNSDWLASLRQRYRHNGQSSDAAILSEALGRSNAQRKLEEASMASAAWAAQLAATESIRQQFVERSQQGQHDAHALNSLMGDAGGARRDVHALNSLMGGAHRDVHALDGLMGGPQRDVDAVNSLMGGAQRDVHALNSLMGGAQRDVDAVNSLMGGSTGVSLGLFPSPATGFPKAGGYNDVHALNSFMSGGLLVNTPHSHAGLEGFAQPEHRTADVDVLRGFMSGVGWPQQPALAPQALAKPPIHAVQPTTLERLTAAGDAAALRALFASGPSLATSSIGRHDMSPLQTPLQNVGALPLSFANGGSFAAPSLGSHGLSPVLGSALTSATPSFGFQSALSSMAAPPSFGSLPKLEQTLLPQQAATLMPPTHVGHRPLEPFSQTLTDEQRLLHLMDGAPVAHRPLESFPHTLTDEQRLLNLLGSASLAH
eukprot:TRINITY_DN20902_c0_g1_i1.p1 TRINITY_DN20902_c0_g1~~TRINITY_DN20902_c0_g1_i1.p1  ORF type:complete len:670 (+),score=92.26 TRINITY_DN20902_c0_g1_i1:111-2120(+)